MHGGRKAYRGVEIIRGKKGMGHKKSLDMRICPICSRKVAYVFGLIPYHSVGKFGNQRCGASGKTMREAVAIYNASDLCKATGVKKHA